MKEQAVSGSRFLCSLWDIEPCGCFCGVLSYILFSCNCDASDIQKAGGAAVQGIFWEMEEQPGRHPEDMTDQAVPGCRNKEKGKNRDGKRKEGTGGMLRGI